MSAAQREQRFDAAGTSLPQRAQIIDGACPQSWECRDHSTQIAWRNSNGRSVPNDDISVDGPCVFVTYCWAVDLKYYRSSRFRPIRYTHLSSLSRRPGADNQGSRLSPRGHRPVPSIQLL